MRANAATVHAPLISFKQPNNFLYQGWATKLARGSFW